MSSVPLIANSSRTLTITQPTAGSPLTPVFETCVVAGALLAGDNRTWVLSRRDNGHDRTRLNWLLKRSTGVFGGRHQRNVADLLADLT